MALSVYAAFLAACIVIILVPGPTVTLIVANSIRHGTRAGLANAAGTQAGMALVFAVVGVGLASVIEGMGRWFELVRFAGAAYLVWMGVQMLRSKGRLNPDGTLRPPRGGFFLQGLLVALSNPKALIFFGAFLPQFLDPARDTTTQLALMGATALAVGALSDAAYSLAAGSAGRLLSARRVRLLSKISGGFLVGGGAWLALSRVR